MQSIHIDVIKTGGRIKHPNAMEAFYEALQFFIENVRKKSAACKSFLCLKHFVNLPEKDGTQFK